MKIGGYGFYDPLTINSALRSKALEDANTVNKIRETGDTEINRAFKDMEKDRSLAQYQYFVGGAVIDSSEDGVVIQKSGFDL
jgi:hypothetical protein